MVTILGNVFLGNVLSSNGFIPHGHCYLWKPELVWLHIVSDSAIAVAYYSIPLLLIYFISQRKDVPFSGVFLLFGAFIIACGTGHLMDIWTLWHPNYWASGMLKAFTAIISVYTALELVPLIPKALALPSPAQLAAANDALSEEILERKRIEQSLRQAEETAKNANRAKSEFLANMSHELRTPLNGILGYAQILKKSRDLTAQQQQGLNVIAHCGEHLLTLINDILDLSKIEARKMELHVSTFHFLNFLEGVSEICRVRAEQKDIAFVCNVCSPLPTAIRADEKRLRQVLLNLLGNAIKFTEAGKVALKVSQHKGKLRFQVEDTGVGIAAGQLEAIFLPFQQTGSVKRQAEGTGLGLAISRTWVELMGGELHVKSELGQGSTFWFDLELPEVSDPATVKKETEQAIVGFEGKTRKVLVVDDKLQNRCILVGLLSPLGFDVIEASNGQECLEKAIDFQPDLILTDLAMPVMDGFELTRRIRQIPELQSIVVIATSASVFDQDQQQSLGVGCNAFIPKPIREKQLLEQLQIHLNLQWIYDQSPVASPDDAKPDLPPTAIIPPSAADLIVLLDLAMQGDLRGIREQTSKLEQMSQELIPFARQVQRFLQNFEEEQLLAFIKHYQEAS